MITDRQIVYFSRNNSTCRPKITKCFSRHMPTAIFSVTNCSLGLSVTTNILYVVRRSYSVGSITKYRPKHYTIFSLKRTVINIRPASARVRSPWRINDSKTNYRYHTPRWDSTHVHPTRRWKMLQPSTHSSKSPSKNFALRLRWES